MRHEFTRRFLDRIHYLPSAVVFYRRSFGYDVPIELIEFDKLRGLLRNNFLNENLQENKQEEKDNGKNHGDILANMSVSDLSEEMIEDICALFAVDVLIMRHLNMEDKYCKGHVSDKYASTLVWGM